MLSLARTLATARAPAADSGARAATRARLYVSPSGSDEYGRGTPDRPLRTLQAALDAALEPEPEPFPALLRPVQDARVEDGKAARAPRSWAAGHRETGAGASPTRAVYVNMDRVVVLPGTYAGTGNVALDPRGKVVAVAAANGVGGAGRATIDCEGSAPRAAPGVLVGAPTHPLPQRGVLQLDGIDTQRCGAHPAPGALPIGGDSCPSHAAGCGSNPHNAFDSDVYAIYHDYR